MGFFVPFLKTFMTDNLIRPTVCHIKYVEVVIACVEVFPFTEAYLPEALRSEMHFACQHVRWNTDRKSVI